MFTNSIGAPVKSLLINHFNRIVVIDLRYYRDEYKARLSLQQIVDEFDIDQILILGESQFFVDAKDLAK